MEGRSYDEDGVVLIIGDLDLVEPLGCLRDNEYHPWILLTFTSIKAIVSVAAVRSLPLLETVLMRLLHKSIMEGRRQHFKLSSEKHICA